MANFNFDAVIKIGSMALIRKEDNDLDYNIFARLASELKPGFILVSSGATEIGRIDFLRADDQISGFGIGRPVQARVHALHRRHRGRDAGDARVQAARIRGTRHGEPEQQRQE